MLSPIVQSGSASYPYPYLRVTGDKLTALVKSQMDRKMGYGLGAKIVPIDLQGPQLLGRDVDCSGDFRWFLWHALGGPDLFGVPDGSVNQHAYLVRNRFKMSSYESALLQDGYVRCGVLSPGDEPEGIGHIWIVYNGMTIESHGHHGPDMRVLSDAPILKPGHYFVLSPPPSMWGAAL